MIHRSLAVLCAATSLAENVFDMVPVILEGDSLKMEMLDDKGREVKKESKRMDLGSLNDVCRRKNVSNSAQGTCIVEKSFTCYLKSRAKFVQFEPSLHKIENAFKCYYHGSSTSS